MRFETMGLVCLSRWAALFVFAMVLPSFSEYWIKRFDRARRVYYVYSCSFWRLQFPCNVSDEETAVKSTADNLTDELANELKNIKTNEPRTIPFTDISKVSISKYVYLVGVIWLWYGTAGRLLFSVHPVYEN